MAVAPKASPVLTDATLSHLIEDPLYKKEVPYEIWADSVPSDVPRTNVKLEIIEDCSLTDVNGLDKQPQLDLHGFQWFRQSFPCDTGLVDSSFVDLPAEQQREMLKRYVNSMSEFLNKELGYSKVLCWDWRVRKSQLSKARTAPGIYFPSGNEKKPEDVRAAKIDSSHIIHVDGSPNWIQEVICSTTSESVLQSALKGNYRLRVLTIWRPLVDIVETDPLVCCDTRTVDDADLDVVQKIMDDAVEEGMYLKRRSKHQWYWKSSQTRDEVLVMNVWDSYRPFQKSAGVAHCSMSLPNHPPTAKPRESIELRYIVWADA